MDKQMVLEWAKMLMSYKFALDEMSTKLTILNEELQFVQHYNPIEHVKTRIKSPESIVEKLQRKGLEVSKENAAAHIRDIAGRTGHLLVLHRRLPCIRNDTQAG